MPRGSPFHATGGPGFVPIEKKRCAHVPRRTWDQGGWLQGRFVLMQLFSCCPVPTYSHVVLHCKHVCRYKLIFLFVKSLQEEDIKSKRLQYQSMSELKFGREGTPLLSCSQLISDLPSDRLVTEHVWVCAFVCTNLYTLCQLHVCAFTFLTPDWI